MVQLQKMLHVIVCGLMAFQKIDKIVAYVKLKILLGCKA
jgi:hypothetical protein